MFFIGFITYLFCLTFGLLSFYDGLYIYLFIKINSYIYNACINNNYWSSSNNINLQVVGNILFYYYLALNYLSNTNIYIFLQNRNVFIENNILYLCSSCLSYLINMGLREIVKSPNTFNTYRNILQINKKFNQEIPKETYKEEAKLDSKEEVKEEVKEDKPNEDKTKELKKINKLTNIDTIKFNISFVTYIDKVLRDSSVENALRKINDIKIILDNKYDKLILDDKSARNNKSLLESIKADNKDN